MEDFVRRFWALPLSERRGVLLSLGLITREEIKLAEPERVTLAFIRARDRGTVGELTKAVEAAEYR